MLLRKNFVLCADMWPKPQWTPDGEGNINHPLHQDPKANKVEEDLRIQVALPNFGSALKAQVFRLKTMQIFRSYWLNPKQSQNPLGPKTGIQFLQDFLMFVLSSLLIPAAVCKRRITLPLPPVWLGLALYLLNKNLDLKRLSHIRNFLRKLLLTPCKFLRLTNLQIQTSSDCGVQLRLWRPRP